MDERGGGGGEKGMTRVGGGRGRGGGAGDEGSGTHLRFCVTKPVDFCDRLLVGMG